MSDKFNPAPLDKHAADPKEAAKADRATHNEPRKGLKELPGVGPHKRNATGAVQA